MYTLFNFINNLFINMKILITLLFISILISSCGKKEAQLSSDDLKKKELELKEKTLDSIDKARYLKDSVDKLSNYKWEGDYSYTVKEDKNHEWHFDLRISKEQNGYSAIFDVFGFQTTLPMKGNVVIEGNRAKIIFDKFYEAAMKSDMKKGDLLVELENTGADILTYWHKAMILETEKSGVVALKKVKGESFSFMNKEIVFGTNLENFLSLYTEFKVNNELKKGIESGASYTSKQKGCEITYNVYFDNSGLKRFEMKSNCASFSDEQYIKSILKQFKHIPVKVADEEEVGDIMETYKKGKLTASEFIGGFYQLTIERSK